MNAVWDYYGHGADGKDSRVYLSWIDVTKDILKQEGSQGSASAVSFSDVAETAWYADAVAWAVEKGITNGTSDTEFSPDHT
ncbi:MAG: S-layer homology domain-containing protein [Firmicutes bacterium]|nr:S-layer homology domain-containing protein [Bacillota bacterium]